MRNKKLWFKAKRYGWGWTPTTWQGWLSMLVYIVVLYKFALVAKTDPSGASLTIMEIKFVFLTLILLALCYTKGEHPHWRWGGK